MIKGNNKSGRVPTATAICDECGREEVAACDYERGSHGTWAPDEGQMLKKMQGHGWAVVKGKLRCPHCEAKRKGAEKWIKAAEAEVIAERKAMENVTDLRQPTREQRRDIRAALDLHYDMAAQRYSAGETDLTVAKMVGGGCMPGWVAEERELGYGPDGGNEQIEKVAADILALESKVKLSEGKAAAALADAATAQKDIIGIKAEIAALSKSITAIKAAVGPKAARA